MNNTYFKGKVSFYQNINGKEKSFEKEFDNRDEYEDFIEDKGINDYVNQSALLSNDSLFGIMDDFFSHKLDNWFNQTEGFISDDNQSEELDIRELEREAKKLEYQEQKKKRNKQRLENQIEKLKEFKKKFKKYDKEEKVKEANEKIGKIREKLQNL